METEKKEDIIAQLWIDVVVPFNRLRWFYDLMLYVLYLSGHKSIFCIHKKKNKGFQNNQ